MNFGVVVNSTLIVTAVGYGALATFAAAAPFFGGLLPLVFFLSLWRYAYEVLRAFAQGHREVPAADFDTVNPFSRWLFLLQLAGFAGAIVCARIYLPGGTLVGVLIAMAFPASAALITMTSRLDSAFSPVAIADCIRILGGDYVKLVAAQCVLVAAVGLGAALVAQQGGFLASLVVAVLGAWSLLAVFALIGSAIHAHRLDFDIPGDRPDPAERERADRERAWQLILDQAYASLRGGRPEAGYRDLRQFLAEQNDSPDAWYWLVENLFDWEDKRHALGVAARLISTELELGRPANALELYRRCRRFGNGADVAAEDAAALETYARSVGQEGIASELAERGRPPAGAPGP